MGGSDRVNGDVGMDSRDGDEGWNCRRQEDRNGNTAIPEAKGRGVYGTSSAGNSNGRGVGCIFLRARVRQSPVYVCDAPTGTSRSPIMAQTEEVGLDEVSPFYSILRGIQGSLLTCSSA